MAGRTESGSRGSAGGDLAPHAGARAGHDAPVGGEPVDQLQAPSRGARGVDAAEHRTAAGRGRVGHLDPQALRPPLDEHVDPAVAVGDAVQEAVRDELGHEQAGRLDHRLGDAGLEPRDSSARLGDDRRVAREPQARARGAGLYRCVALVRRRLPPTPAHANALGDPSGRGALPTGPPRSAWWSSPLRSVARPGTIWYATLPIGVMARGAASGI